MPGTIDRVEQLLGVGLYSQAEAARYARISSSQKLGNWLFGTRKRPPVLNAQLESQDSGDRIVTFRDFVQLLAIRAIRIEKKISLQKIRSAVDHARDRYGMSHPFAMQHTTYLFGNDILIVPPDKDDDIVQITGNVGQQAIRPVVELYMEQLTFDPQDGLATRYRIYARNDRTVEMDPRFLFGQPYLPSCRYPAEVLIQAYRTEGGILPAAEAFDVDTEDVKTALAFHDHLVGSEAA